MKSNIKKNYILKYLQTKFNDTSQELGFMFGVEGMPLYQPITKESSTGDANETFEFDEETYQLSTTSYIPVSFPVITSDYANLATIEQDKRITSSSWSAVVSFLVFTNSYFHNNAIFAMEEFRDKFLGKLDFMEGREYDYSEEGLDVTPTTKWYTVATHAQDIEPGGLITINGSKYIEYTLQIDLDVADELAYGNQFEFYIKSAEEDSYSRVLPIQASWGASNSLEGKQLLNNSNLSVADADKAKMIHSLVSSRGFAINYTFIFNPSDDILIDLFKETYIKKDTMNTPFWTQMKFKNKEMVDSVPTWAYDTRLGFEYKVIISEGAT